MRLAFVVLSDFSWSELDPKDPIKGRADVLCRCALAVAELRRAGLDVRLFAVDRDGLWAELAIPPAESSEGETHRMLAGVKPVGKLDELLDRIRQHYDRLLILDEAGEPLWRAWREPSGRGVAIILGGPRGIPLSLLEPLARLEAIRVSLGRVPYLASMCILIMGYAILRGEELAREAEAQI